MAAHVWRCGVSAPDFAAILGGAIYYSIDTDCWMVDPAAKVPEACPHSLAGEECPDCPSIATLLAYGWNVARCVPTIGFGSEGYVNAVGEGTCFRPIELLDALRTIEVAP